MRNTGPGGLRWRLSRPGWLVAVLWFGSLGGCGYSFEGGSSALPPEIKTIAIPMFVNDTEIDGIEASFTAALIDAFWRGHQIRVIDSTASADAVVLGRITRMTNEAVSFSEKDNVLEFEITATVAVKLKRRSDGAILWQDDRVRVKDEYGVDAESVVTSSPDFRGRESSADPTALGLQSIEVSETEHRAAVDRLSRSFAKTVYLRMMQDF